ncbi:MAG TPA: GNAT family N-acetyltransferase [Terriglobia bacterium]|nr:GNAT family N-acetyltransferase [Terriglobia bacterium]
MIRIRPANPDDAERIAALATQLGYPSTPAQVASRLERLLRDDEHAIFVAAQSALVVGWVHVFEKHLLESEPEAEIGGLVVDENHRRAGAGKLLMERAEEWARSRGLKSVYLRSNVIRKEAHAFYEKLGYHVSQNPDGVSQDVVIAARPKQSAYSRRSCRSGSVL